MKHQRNTARRLTEQQIKNIPILMGQGITPIQISKYYNCSKSTISYYTNPKTKRKSQEKSKITKQGIGNKIRRFLYCDNERKNKILKEVIIKNSGHVRLYSRIKKFRFVFRKGKFKKDMSKYKVPTESPNEFVNTFWPGLKLPSSKNSNPPKKCQAVNQVTGELDYYDNGNPIMYPNIRDPYSNKIINAEDVKTSIDHIDKNIYNNHSSNAFFTDADYNSMKAQKTPDELYEMTKQYNKNYEKTNGFKRTIKKKITIDSF